MATLQLIFLISFVFLLLFKSHLRDGMGREEGGGFRMGNTCIPVADYVKFKNKIKFKILKKKKKEYSFRGRSWQSSG